MNDNSNGRTWARFWLIVTLFVSVVMNVTHAVLADSDITLWLRVPGALLWPVLTFAGIEIVVRIVWEKRLPHSVTRLSLLAASIPAAITSYEHQYTLLGMMGETAFIQAIGPIAVDGLMIGCTMTLLLTRPRMMPIAAPAPTMTDDEFECIIARLDADVAANLGDIPIEALMMNDVHDNPPPARPVIEAAPRTRRHATSAAQERAVLLLLEGRKVPEIATEVGAGASTVARWAKVTRELRDNPAVQIDYIKERVSPDLVAFIRTEVSK